MKTRTEQFIGRSTSDLKYFQGDLDDLRLYDVVLTDSEISTLHGEATTGIHYQAQALNNPTGFSASGLPLGLSINPSTGAITGHTTSVGDHNVTLTASNLSGTSPTKNLILTVAPANPLFETEPFGPSTLPSLKLWLDASDSGSITHSSNAVSQWNDKSGNNNHATQSSTGDKPTYSNTGMSGKAGLDFDNDKLSIPAIDMEGKTLLAVIQPDTSTVQQILSHSSINVQLRLSASNQLQYAASSPLYTNGTASTGTIANNQISIVSFTLDDTLGFSINGTFQDSGVNKGSSGSSIFNQIGTNGASAERFNGKMGEVLIISSVSSSEREKIEGYLAHKWGLSGNLPNSHPYKQSVTKQPKITVSSIGTNSATVSADLLDLGGATTSLKVLFAEPDGTVLKTPETLSGLKLWLDASDLNTAGSTWADKSGNNNSGTKTGAPSVVTNAQNGLSVMHYTGNGQWHDFSAITDIRTVFWVVSQDSSANGSGFRFLLCGASGSHFHNDNNGKFWGNSANNNIKSGATRMNGTSLSGHTNYPNNLSIISLKTLGNVSADRFGQDRGFNGRQWIGKLGELLIYNSALSDSEIARIEGYLAHKWGLTGNLPASHDYKVSLPGNLENVSSGQTTMGLAGLSSATTYNIRVQATNSAGSSLSDTISFTTGSVPNPPALSVSSPTVVGTTTATAKGNLLSFDGTTRPSVTLYYGTSDGNQTAGNWGSNVNLSTKPIGSLDHNLTGLSTGTTYYYRYFATTTIGGTAYSTFSELGTFTTLAPPTVQTLAVSPIFQSGATLNAKPTLSGNDAASITFYWGDNNGSNNGSHDQWDQNFAVSGTYNSGDVIHHAITGLTAGTTYYAVAKVTNSFNASAYGSVVSFKASDRAFTKNSIPGLVLWLDANDIDGNGNPDSLGDGSSISAWIDKSTKGVTVNQTNFGSKPIYKSASFGSKPAVRFDGIDDVLNLTPIRSSAGGYSVYVATRRHDTLGDDNAHIIDEATWSLVASNSNQPYGTKIVAQSGASGATLTNLKIGKDAGGTNNDFGGDIGEILIFERQLSSTEEAKVVDHLVHKWGASPVAIFSPTSIPNLQLWLDASDTSSISKNSSNQVSQWNDKSGNGRNVSQSGANNIKPTLSSNSMKFSGSQYLFNTTPFMYSNGSIEIFMVASGNTQSDTRILFEGSTSSNNPFYAFQINNTAPQNKLAAYIRNTENSTRRSQAAILNDVAMDGTSKLLYWKDTGSSVIARVNGGASGSLGYSRTGTMSSNRFCVGGVLRASFGSGFIGEIKEIIISSPNPDNNRLEIEKYLGAKWRLDNFSTSHSQPITHIDVPPLFDNTPKFVEKPYLSNYSVGFSPSELGNVSYWLDAEDLSTITKDGSNKVSAWNDKSGNAKHATMATSNRQPTYVASDPVLNGKPSVKSSSNNGKIGLTISSSPQREIFMVVYFNDGIDNNFGEHMNLFSSSGTDGQYRIQGTKNYGFITSGRAFNNSMTSMNGHASSWQVLPMPATVLRLKSSSTRTQSTNLLFHPTQNNRGWVGGIGEMIALSSVATSDEASKIEGYLAHKWGIAQKLIATHSEYNRISGEVGTALSFQLEAIQGPETWTADNTLASKGLSLNSSTGLITGTPNAEGNFTTAITVANSGGSEQRNVFFNITKGTRVIDWNQTFAGITYGDNNFSLSGSASGSSNLYYSSSDPSILEINGSTVEYPAVSNGLVSWWRFDETSGTTASPSTGSHNGTLNSPASFGTGKFGNAVVLTGATGSRATFPAAAGNLGKSFSVSLWVKWGNSGANPSWTRILENRQTNNTSKGFLIYASSSTKLHLKSGTLNSDRGVIADWKNGNWVHLVTAIDNGMVSTYADGSFIGTDDINPVANSTSNLTLGSEVGGGSRWNGAVDELRLYDRTLTQSDVTTIYGGGNGDFVSVRTGSSVSIKKTGSVTLTAHAPATASMNAASLVNQTITVSKAP